jgi:hypothetical protein
MLPPLKKNVKQSDPKIRREYHKHRQWVRRHACCVPGCQNTHIEFAHVRNAANSGTGLKPYDWYGISLCTAHHSQQHNVGSDTFQELYKINLMKLADEFANKSPDTIMQENRAKYLAGER